MPCSNIDANLRVDSKEIDPYNLQHLDEILLNDKLKPNEKNFQQNRKMTGKFGINFTDG